MSELSNAHDKVLTSSMGSFGSHNKHNQKIPVRLIALTAVLSACLAALTAYWKKDSIELNLTQDARKALSIANLPAVDINFQGRAATLNGTVPDDTVAEDIMATISNVFGVREVSNQLIPEPAGVDSMAGAAELMPPEFEDDLYIPPRFHPLEKYNLSDVQFIYAKAALAESSFPVLDRLAQLLQQNEQIQVELSVHTDNQGTALGQIAATEVRAATLRQYMLGQGVRPEQLVTNGYGATRPIASNDTAEGRQKNRSVDIIVLKDQ